MGSGCEGEGYGSKLEPASCHMVVAVGRLCKRKTVMITLGYSGLYQRTLARKSKDDRLIQLKRFLQSSLNSPIWRWRRVWLPIWRFHIIISDLKLPRYYDVSS